MNPREQRGVLIAAMCKLNREGGEWIVPSQTTGERTYRVNVTLQTCTCLDHTDGGEKCKHLYAAEFTMRREVASDGTVTETKSITFREEVKYTQDWPTYDRAQMEE